LSTPAKATDDPATEPNRRAWQALSTWDKPFLTVFSDNDPITAAMGPVLRATIPGASGRDHPMLSGGHFIQEDAGPELAQAIAAFLAVP
jgi:haloalkane dehalogenase